MLTLEKVLEIFENDLTPAMELDVYRGRYE